MGTSTGTTTSIVDHPYASFVGRVQKPSRYLGGENGEIRKDWSQAQGRMCLAFPDVYEVGMSHLGFKILYSQINAHKELLAERVYAPWVDMEQELRQRGEPLRSLETWHALSEFDVVGFSLQFELTFTNVLQMLELGGIPLRSEARGEADPLVVAGGPTATHPEPMAPFFDVVVIGDGEAVTLELLRSWTEGKRSGLSRAERLRRLARLPGCYVPALYETALDEASGLQYVARPLDEAAPLPVRRAFVADISEYPFPTDGPISTTETVFDRVSVEIARGCTEGCRFCQAGMIYRPVRERRPDEVIAAVRHSIKDAGYDSASLTSLSTADYSAISPLIHKLGDELKDSRASLSVSSLRAYGLAEDVLDRLKQSGTRGLTFAPEAGSQRMRDVINKNVTEEQLMETARRVFSRGWDRMKLYFMIGLPTEEDEDVLGTVQTGARALAIGRRLMGKRATVTVNVSTLVPKPHTPFQWCAMNTRDEVLHKQQRLRDEAKKSRVTLRVHDSRGSWIEGVLARGDRRLADAVESAYRAGARFDSWEDQLDLEAWQRAFEQHGVEPGKYLGTLPLDARLPWEHIDVGLEPGFLAREYRKALKGRLSPPCGKAVGDFVHPTNLEAHDADRRKLVCYHCGVACDLGAMREQRREYLVQLDAKRPRGATQGARTPEAADAPCAAADAPTADADAPCAAADAPTADADAPCAAADARASEVERADALAAANEPAPKPRFKPRRPPERPDQGEAIRLRLHFEKLGRAAFASHLDLVRILPRLFRRLELPLYYSRGYHPKPQLVFGPALSLGIASLAEYVDVKLSRQAAVDLARLPEALSEAAVDGVRFVGVAELSPSDGKLNRAIDEGHYVAALPRGTLAAHGLGTREALETRIAERRAGSLAVRRVIEGIGKRVDVGEYLVAADVGAGAETLSRAGLVGELVPLRLKLRITQNGTAKPSEALEALLAEPELPVRYVREALLWVRGDERGTPMDLQALRRHDHGAKAVREAASDDGVPAAAPAS